jgi:GNAT superfamily N-acetyltransferase
MEPLAVRGNVVLRRAVVVDLPGIVALLRDDPLGVTRESTDVADYAEAFEVIARDPGQLLLVLAMDEAVVGTAQLTFIPGLSYRGAIRAQLEAVRVRADLRGSGLGTWLVQWAVEEARRRGCAMVQLTSNQSRTDALRFYSRLGFAPSHVGFKLIL